MSKTPSYRIRRLSKQHGGMKTPLMLKAMSQYLNPKSGSDLSLSDQIKFEKALENSRKYSKNITRNDVYSTLKRPKSSRPSSSRNFDISKTNFLDDYALGGRRKSRKKTPKQIDLKKSKRKRSKKNTKKISKRYRRGSRKHSRH